MNWLGLLWILVVVASAAWVLANILVIAFSPLARQLTQTRIHLLTMALLPWLLPPIAVLTLLFLAIAKVLGWIHHHCETHLGIHPHFCFEHLPETALQLSGSLSGLFIVVGAFGLTFARLKSLMVLHTKSKSFHHLASSKSLINILENEQPLAFTIGGLKPAIFISNGLKSILSPTERRSVIQHEIAHIRNKDVLKNTLFELLLSIHIFPSLLRAPWHLSSELRADQYVAKSFGPLLVAEVLIKLRRVGMNAPFPSSIVGGHLAERIRVLINNESSNQTSRGIYLLYLLIAAFPFVLAISHHSLETLWGWIL